MKYTLGFLLMAMSLCSPILAMDPSWQHEFKALVKLIEDDELKAQLSQYLDYDTEPVAFEIHDIKNFTNLRKLNSFVSNLVIKFNRSDAKPEQSFYEELAYLTSLKELTLDGISLNIVGVHNLCTSLKLKASRSAGLKSLNIWNHTRDQSFAEQWDFKRDDPYVGRALSSLLKKVKTLEGIYFQEEEPLLREESSAKKAKPKKASIKPAKTASTHQSFVEQLKRQTRKDELDREANRIFNDLNNQVYQSRNKDNGTKVDQAIKQFANMVANFYSDGLKEDALEWALKPQSQMIKSPEGTPSFGDLFLGPPPCNYMYLTASVNSLGGLWNLVKSKENDSLYLERVKASNLAAVVDYYRKYIVNDIRIQNKDLAFKHVIAPIYEIKGKYTAQKYIIDMFDKHAKAYCLSELVKSVCQERNDENQQWITSAINETIKAQESAGKELRDWVINFYSRS